MYSGVKDTLIEIKDFNFIETIDYSEGTDIPLISLAIPMKVCLNSEEKLEHTLTIGLIRGNEEPELHFIDKNNLCFYNYPSRRTEKRR